MGDVPNVSKGADTDDWWEDSVNKKWMGEGGLNETKKKRRYCQRQQLRIEVECMRCRHVDVPHALNVVLSDTSG
jgi:hypothetical protein